MARSMQAAERDLDGVVRGAVDSTVVEYREALGRRAVVVSVTVAVVCCFFKGVSTGFFSLEEGGDRRSNNPITFPFFCGVGPIILRVRSDEGVG